MRPESEYSQRAGTSQQGSVREVPADFANRIATKIILTSDRERDSDLALEKVASVILRNLAAADRLRYLIECTEVLLANDDTRRYAGVAWASFSVEQDTNHSHGKFVSDVLDVIIDDHMRGAKPEYELEYKRKKFSAYARLLGEVFINMMELNSELYEMLSAVYAAVIRKEMAIEQKEKEEKGSRRINLLKERDSGPTVGKKLFDDVVDYIHARGEFKSDSLNQQNPNEFIAILADRMRGTRRYVIQDIMNRQSLARKKEAEKELSERLASAEEIILARDTFKKAINLFWTEKRYNFKYLSVEKVRVTVQVLAIMVGILFFLMGYLRIADMYWWEGAIVLAGMYLYARFAGSRQSFHSFFPDDVSKELEVVVGSFTPALRKMSKQQLDSFLIRQVRDPANVNLLTILPEFVKYVFAVMPERKNAIVTMEELGEIMDNMELDIARAIRANQSGREPPI